MGRLVDNYIVDHGPVTSNLRARPRDDERCIALLEGRLCFGIMTFVFIQQQQQQQQQQLVWDHSFCPQLDLS